MRLVEKTETHVLVRLLLLLLLLLSSGGSVTTSSGGTTGSGGSTTSRATGWDGGELGRTLSDQLQRVSDCALSSEAHCKRASHLTSLMSLPSSSEMSLSRRSLSASMPTDSRTSLMSEALGEVFPPRPRRRYAARCFILMCGCRSRLVRTGVQSI
jgi:hypothetical protein